MAWACFLIHFKSVKRIKPRVYRSGKKQTATCFGRRTLLTLARQVIPFVIINESKPINNFTMETCAPSKNADIV